MEFSNDDPTEKDHNAQLLDRINLDDEGFGFISTI